MVGILALGVVSLVCVAFGADDVPAEAPALPPVPAPKDAAGLGRGIQRAMTLMATSTPRQRHKVKVLYYGQSITNQAWTEDVSRYLEEKYPHADFTFAKLSLGGFASQMLVRTTDYDVLPFYPDLVLLMLTGDHRRYEDILIKVRENTTAEIAIQTDHISAGSGDWSEKMSYEYLPSYAKRYGCCLMDIRTPWREYLEKNGFEPKKFLSDGTHLNPDGCWLMASIVEQCLVYRPDLPDTGWKNLARDYAVGKDLKWRGGKLKLEFTGNRVDAYSAWTGASAAQNARVLIDGRAPSEFPAVYFHARPSGAPNISHWPAIKRITWQKPLVLETWTAKCHDFSDDAKVFRFEVSGSVTGPDGQDTSTEKFTSTSGRVLIDPQDWTFDYDRSVGRKPMPESVTVTWQTRGIFTDTYAPLKAEDPAREYPTTLAQGLPNAAHTLELVSESGKPMDLSSIRVYEPPFTDVEPLHGQPRDY